MDDSQEKLVADHDDVVEEDGKKAVIPTDEHGEVENLPPAGEGEPVTTTTEVDSSPNA